MIPTVATAVVDGYEARARFARAETDMVSSPRLLSGLLRTIGHVAEVPCGAGHFLADYAATGVETTLMDGNAAMLAAAVERAAAVGLPGDRIHAHIGYLQQLDDLMGVDLVVMPNDALNQMACQTPPVELLAAIYRALSPGVELLAQVACTHPGGRMDTTGCYDPGRRHGIWFADHYLDPNRACGAVLRRRRQHHAANGTHVRVRCRSLTATVAVDCLTGYPPNSPSLPTSGFELVTQFGLLGLCRMPSTSSTASPQHMNSSNPADGRLGRTG
ncbi:MAG: methyltransferase domain-containing protein [Pseudonocardiaceae bacterium]